MPKKKQVEFDYSNDNFGLVLNAAVRYSLGRRTYMPGAVTAFITPLLPLLSNRTLWCFDQDVTEQKYYGGYGDKCDDETWLTFLAFVRAEREARGEELYKSYHEKEEF